MEAWRVYMQSLEDPPMMLDLNGFVDQVRQVNPLVSVENCKQLGEQLQVRFLLIKKLSVELFAKKIFFFFF